MSEFEDLRRAWRDLPAPPPERELTRPDAQTERALEWMRGAWDALEAPPATCNLQRRARSRRRLRMWRSRAPLAAAAALIAVLALRSLPGEHGTPTPEAPSVSSDPRPEPRSVEIASVSPDRMELHSGPVRLILMTRKDESYQ